MSLYSTHQLPDAPIEGGEMHLQNLSNSDFSMQYFDDENKPHTVLIPALDTQSFPTALGHVVRNHLATFMLNEQGFSYKTDPQDELTKIKERITIYE